MSDAAGKSFAQRVTVGTAGHVDHGKTRLLEALTGEDCDRWAEEKARGITIDLGFTHLEAGDLQIGFIDVPGHQRFLHNALAGLGGIRLVLLVVAADEGVKPQTREHLAICRLLGIEEAILVLSKRDLVDDDMLELAELEVTELVDGTPYAEAPVMAVSSHTGDGIEALRQAIIERGERLAIEAEPGALFRLPIDRAFQLRGLGTVVTGTLISGRVEPGQQLEVLPRGATARVRSLQVHGEDRTAASQGERTALQLTGVELADLGRGEQLTTPGTLAAGRRLCARLTLLDDAGETSAGGMSEGSSEAVTGWIPIRYHGDASEVIGRLRPLGKPIEPGGDGLVEIRLAHPIVTVRGDRFIIRRPSPAATLGGGVVLDPHWRRRRGASLERALARLASRDGALRLWVDERRERGVSADELSPRLGLRATAVAKMLDGLAADGHLLAVGGGKGKRWLSPNASQRVIERGRRLVEAYFDQNRLAAGMPKAELVGRLLPASARDLAPVYLRFLEAQKVARVDGDLVNPPGRRADAHMTGEENELSSRLLALIESEGLTPPSPAELSRSLNAKPQIVAGIQKYLIQQGKLARLSSGLLVSSAAVERLREELTASDWQSFSVGEFKDRYELSRKWAIPWLEHLDSIGVTRRVGNERQIVRR